MVLSWAGSRQRVLGLPLEPQSHSLWRRLELLWQSGLATSALGLFACQPDWVACGLLQSQGVVCSIDASVESTLGASSQVQLSMQDCHRLERLSSKMPVLGVGVEGLLSVCRRLENRIVGGSVSRGQCCPVEAFTSPFSSSLGVQHISLKGAGLAKQVTQKE